MAAIVSADVVGYSRLMGADETGTLALLRGHRSELIDPLVEKHGGRIVKTTGDGLLLEFPSVVAAVECMITVQEGMVSRNSGVPEDQAVRFRVGVHLGDVIVVDDDIFGDGVNVAARLEGLSEADGLALSDDAYRQVRDRLDADWHDDGEHEVKNIVRPLQVWRWLPSSAPDTVELASTPSDGNTLAVLPDIPSVAVLPFDSLSDDEDHEFFAAGICEDIGTELSRFNEMFVISRNATSSFVGSTKTMKELASELGVRHILAGSIRRSASRVRVSAQLIDGATGGQVWADRFDRSLDDIFEIQDEISAVIVNTLLGKLRYKEFERSLHKRPEALDAYDLVLRATVLLTNWNKSDALEAREAASAAVEIDPNFARAHALLGWAYCLEATLRWVDETALWFDLGYRSASKAVEIDDAEPWAHASLGFAQLWGRHRYEEGLASLRQAIALNPNNAYFHLWISNALCLAGHQDEAMAAIQTAMRLHPNFPPIYLHFLTRILVTSRRFGEALPHLERLITAMPTSTNSLATYAACNAGLGRMEAALRAVSEILRISPTFSLRTLREQSPFALEEDLETYRSLLRLAGLPE